MGLIQFAPEEPRMPTPWQRYYGWFLTDVLMYIVVLNLAAEWVEKIHFSKFSLTLFVAIVLKIIMDAIQRLEHWIKDFFCVQHNQKLIGGFFMWLVMFSSKFLFLWLDDYVFGPDVELGYVWEIVILTAVLIAIETLHRLVYHKLGDIEERYSTTTDDEKDGILDVNNGEEEINGEAAERQRNDSDQNDTPSPVEQV